MRTNARISFVKLSEAERYDPETGEYNKVDKNKMTIPGLVTSVSTDMKAQIFGDIRNQVIAINILRGCDDFRSEEHTSELQSRFDLVCRLLLEKKKKTMTYSEIIVVYNDETIIDISMNG